MPDGALVYRRVLLKLSGEALMGDGDFGIDPKVLDRTAGEIAALAARGHELAIVIGGGNIFRGAGLAGGGMDRVTGDHMGMLATVINSLAMGDALRKKGVDARVLSSLDMNQVCEPYARYRAMEHLDKGRVVILSAGTGSPFFTTDSAASLRAIEVKADLLIKATKVDGVYSADPMKDAAAIFYSSLSYDKALADKLGVMDATALILCRDHDMPLRVMNINQEGALARLLAGEDIGTLVSTGEQE
ncbi:UMP kinase [Thiolapillus brandeum]|uniref:Uridylate kinase n=1 Tax=Thiolapillus brandeum TaxID=1076588 RepID=A0A7U6JIB9_9GAMM|nr:UMP kinase [Thiolapillus brandeum]BAO44080.1 uridylate kinase [Thiolapillus brandeum]